MNGKTIHSWAIYCIKDQLSLSANAIFARKEFRLSIAEAKVLIIDEVSMLHHFRLDMVNGGVAENARKKPFGYSSSFVVICSNFSGFTRNTQNILPVQV
jgi:hypothetical protein